MNDFLSFFFHSQHTLISVTPDTRKIFFYHLYLILFTFSSLCFLNFLCIKIFFVSQACRSNIPIPPARGKLMKEKSCKLGNSRVIDLFLLLLLPFYKDYTYNCRKSRATNSRRPSNERSGLKFDEKTFFDRRARAPSIHSQSRSNEYLQLSETSFFFSLMNAGVVDRNNNQFNASRFPG